MPADTPADIAPAVPPLPGRDAALFLDVDGTLIELAARPDLVVVPPALPSVLGRLLVGLGGAVAVVSGRGLEVLRVLLPVPGLAAAAEHGALLDPPDPDAAPLPVPPDRWRAAADAFALAHPGALAEHKRHGLVLHVRLAPEATAAATALAEALAAERPDEYRVVPAHAALELRPRFADKGRAVHRLMRRAAFAGRRPIFIGDDLTDEDGIAAACALGGLGYRMAEDFAGQPAVLRAWLGRLADRLGSDDPAPVAAPGRVA